MSACAVANNSRALVAICCTCTLGFTNTGTAREGSEGSQTPVQCAFHCETIHSGSTRDGRAMLGLDSRHLPFREAAIRVNFAMARHEFN